MVSPVVSAVLSLLSSPSSISGRTRNARLVTTEHKSLSKAPGNSSLPSSGEGPSPHPTPSPGLQLAGHTHLCCEPEAGRQSSPSPYMWGSRGAPSHSCLPHSHRFPKQPPLAQVLGPLSQALGSRVGRRKKRKRRQHPRAPSGRGPWASCRESAVAGVEGQE